MQVKREKIFTYLTFTMKKVCKKKKKTRKRGNINFKRLCWLLLEKLKKDMYIFFGLPQQAKHI